MVDLVRGGLVHSGDRDQVSRQGVEGDAMQESCDHLYGLLKLKSSYQLLLRSTISIDTPIEHAERFSFCPRCGIQFSWLFGVLGDLGTEQG